MRLVSFLFLGSLCLANAAEGQGRVRPASGQIHFGAAIQDSLVSLARRQVGKPYLHGGANPETGFDCSGLIQYLLHTMRIDIARNSKMQARAGKPVARNLAKLRVGDLLTFGYGSKISHIGVYIGDGKFIHASSERHTVVESLLGRRVAGRIKPWIGARRLLAFVSPTPRDSLTGQR